MADNQVDFLALKIETGIFAPGTHVIAPTDLVPGQSAGQVGRPERVFDQRDHPRPRRLRTPRRFTLWDDFSRLFAESSHEIRDQCKRSPRIAPSGPHRPVWGSSGPGGVFAPPFPWTRHKASGESCGVSRPSVYAWAEIFLWRRRVQDLRTQGLYRRLRLAKGEKVGARMNRPLSARGWAKGPGPGGRSASGRIPRPHQSNDQRRLKPAPKLPRRLADAPAPPTRVSVGGAGTHAPPYSLSLIGRDANRVFRGSPHRNNRIRVRQRIRASSGQRCGTSPLPGSKNAPAFAVRARLTGRRQMEHSRRSTIGRITIGSTRSVSPRTGRIGNLDRARFGCRSAVRKRRARRIRLGEGETSARLACLRAGVERQKDVRRRRDRLGLHWHRCPVDLGETDGTTAGSTSRGLHLFNHEH